MQVEADRMMQSEYDLKAIVLQQGVSFDDVIELAIENKLALDQQKVRQMNKDRHVEYHIFRFLILSLFQMNLRLITVYSVAQIFFQKNVNVSPEMLPILLYRLQCKLRMHGITISHDVLKALINKKSVQGLVKLCCKFLLFGFESDIQEGDELKAFSLQSGVHYDFMKSRHEDELMLAHKASRKVREELILKLSKNMNGAIFFPKEITLYY